MPLIRSKRSVLSGLATLPFVSIAIPAYGHRELLTTTEIKWNSISQTLDITHVFHIHHTEQALKRMGIIPNDDLRNMRNQARLAIYVEDNFSLKNSDGSPIAIKTIGAEAGKADAYVFQECPMEFPPSKLMVKCDFLRPDIPNQINEIHLIIDKQVASIRLSGRQIQKLLIAK